MKRRVFFDSAYNCTRIESPNERGEFSELPTSASSVQVVEESAIPSDRAFRNAWKPDMTVDMLKAREIHRDRLRQMRAPRLRALDEAYLRADERGDITEKQRIATRKQALRDAPADPMIEAATTPEELKAAIPAALTI